MNRRKVLKSLAGGALLASAPLKAWAQAPAKRFRVGISSPEAQNPFHRLLSRSIEEALKQRQIEPMLLSANADVNEQVNNVSDLIAAKVDAILIAPLNSEGPAPVVQRARAAGIPVFMYARALDPKYASLWESFLGMDAVAVGTTKGQWAIDSLKPGKIAMLLGSPGAAPMVEQEQGFRKAVEAKGFRVVFAQSSTMTRENGIKLAEDALIAHKDLVCIYAANDDLALGAAQAVKAAGLRGTVAVVGLNGAPPALAAVHNGDMAATVLLDPATWGRTAAFAVADYLQKGAKPPRFIPMEHRLVVQKDAFDLIPPPLREKFGVKK